MRRCNFHVKLMRKQDVDDQQLFEVEGASPPEKSRFLCTEKRKKNTIYMTKLQSDLMKTFLSFWKQQLLLFSSYQSDVVQKGEKKNYLS